MLTIGQTIQRFRVEELVGQGGIAMVYRVCHLQLESDHALKVLLVSSVDVRERLLLEGKVQANLRHPNIVSVTDVLDLKGV
ncbi:MAG: serine/threonine protein kinase, partial [Myxococcota bacterium]